MLLRAVVFVPDLLGKEMSRSGASFQPANVFVEMMLTKCPKP